MPGIIALIPARAGSKTVSDKNIRLFAGKPLLVHSIEQAQQSALIERVIVSTDSPEYADIARQAGAEVPFMRPAEHASDTATDLDVFTHALQWLQEHEGQTPDIIVQLRPTYPMRDVADIDAAVTILTNDPHLDAVRSIVAAPQTPFKMWLKNDDGTMTPAAPSDLRDAYNLPRQSLPPAYLQNACIDVMRSSTILEKQSMTGDRIYGYEMNHNYDIDTEQEWQRAEQQLLAASEHDDSSVSHKTFCFDIDGVIASITPENDYSLAQPLEDMIAVIRRLHAAGHTIVLNTARGSMSGLDWRETTEKQMKEWNVPYHELHFGKPAADVYVDDRAMPITTLLAHESHG